MSYNPTSDYPECYGCPVKATNECPALYRITEHCPHYNTIMIRHEIEESAEPLDDKCYYCPYWDEGCSYENIKYDCIDDLEWGEIDG